MQLPRSLLGLWFLFAEDKHFAWGQVGIGSFDDTGNFDDVRLWGRLPNHAR